jgi:aldehyde:ferredoxin oxidoreductase
LHADAGRGALVAASEDFASVLDSLIICKFLRKCFADFYVEAADLLSKVTDWDYSEIELRRAGERINTIKRLFNQREGWQPKDDWLPPRLLNEALSTGVAMGVALTAAELSEMIRGYYQARQLDKNGFVTEQKLRELDVLKPSIVGMDACQATRPAAY